MEFKWVCVNEETIKDPWTSFHEAIDQNNKGAVAICKKCQHVMVHPYTKKDRSNSHMWKHLRTKHKKDAGPVPQTQNSTIDAIFARATGVTTPELQRLLLQTMATCNWPFDQFDNEIFRYLLHRGFPGHKVPRRKTMARLLKTAAETSRTEIKVRFEEHDGRISLALDCWTSSNRWEFMGILPLYCSMMIVLV
jgi:hypothetical protein